MYRISVRTRIASAIAIFCTSAFPALAQQRLTLEHLRHVVGVGGVELLTVTAVITVQS
jgi:hypothetical protein